MTEIERMWDGARDSSEHKMVNGTLLDQASYVCTLCGSDADVDKMSGCVTCKTCGNKECGDG